MGSVILLNPPPDKQFNIHEAIHQVTLNHKPSVYLRRVLEVASLAYAIHEAIATEDGDALDKALEDQWNLMFPDTPSVDDVALVDVYDEHDWELVGEPVGDGWVPVRQPLTYTHGWMNPATREVRVLPT